LQLKVEAAAQYKQTEEWGNQLATSRQQAATSNRRRMPRAAATTATTSALEILGTTATT